MSLDVNAITQMNQEQFNKLEPKDKAVVMDILKEFKKYGRSEALEELWYQDLASIVKVAQIAVEINALSGDLAQMDLENIEALKGVISAILDLAFSISESILLRFSELASISTLISTGD